MRLVYFNKNPQFIIHLIFSIIQFYLMHCIQQYLNQVSHHGRQAKGGTGRGSLELCLDRERRQTEAGGGSQWYWNAPGPTTTSLSLILLNSAPRKPCQKSKETLCSIRGLPQGKECFVPLPQIGLQDFPLCSKCSIEAAGLVGWVVS